MDRPFTRADVEDAMFQIDGQKALGPDGFIAAFYQKNWDWIGSEVTAGILAFFQSGYLLKKFDHIQSLLLL